MESVLETLDVAEVSILTQLLPGLERYFGGARESSDATTQINAQALTRQTFVVGVLLECVSKLSGPIVFCMDDLQWASKSSIDSLTAWMSNSKLQRVLFVGTHRPLSQASLVEDSFTRRLLPSDVSIYRIELAPLQMEDVQSMLAGSLGLRDIQQVKSLSRMVHESTSGNVGFLCELLRHFRDQELLCWDGTQWKCDDHMINITWRSIVDLYGSRLVDLDPDTLKTLQVAACIGSAVDETLLGKILKQEDVSQHIRTALTKRLVVFDDSKQSYLFAHDSAQQVLYQTLDETEREQLHHWIGRKLWRSMGDNLLAQETFVHVILSQLFLGKNLIEKDADKSAVAALCLSAGEKAVQTCGFEEAFKFLTQGLEFLGPNKWIKEYSLTLQMQNLVAEVSYCTGRFDTIFGLLEEVLENALCFEDTIQARSTKVYALGACGRMNEAIDLGLETLSSLGEDLSPNPTPLQSSLALWRVRRLIGSRSDQSILRLPQIEDTHKVAAMQFLNLLLCPCLYNNPTLLGMVSIRMVKITLLHGLCPVSAVGFAWYGMARCGGGRNVEEGYRFGKLSLQIYDSYQTDAWLGRLSAAHWGCISSWIDPADVALEPLRRAYVVGLGTGDIEMAMLNACIYCWNSREILSMPELEREISELASRMKLLGQAAALDIMRPLWQMTQCFMGLVDDPKLLKGEILDQEAVFSVVNTNPSLILWTRFHCMVLAYHFSDYNLAESYLDGTEAIFDRFYGAMDASVGLFYYCLTLIAQARVKGRHSRGGRRRAQVVAKMVRQRWTKMASNAPVNFLSKQYLLEGELAAFHGDHATAANKYRSSILHSREGGFLMQEALANERLAKFYIETGSIRLAKPFIRGAFVLYEEWGGTSKIQHLKEEIGGIS